ncbi:MAG: hypothetical protein M3411_02170, partial [Chloroflexota bacterium]|nr:hypothetical protein [Chloroflexota bacterium]
MVGGTVETTRKVTDQERSQSTTETPDADGLLSTARDHVWIHSASWSEVAAERGLQIFDRGDGARLYDVEGREFIDGISGLWVVNAG